MWLALIAATVLFVAAWLRSLIYERSCEHMAEMLHEAIAERDEAYALLERYGDLAHRVVAVQEKRQAREVEE